MPSEIVLCSSYASEGVRIRLTIVPSIDNVDITSSPFSPDNVVSSSSSSRVPAEGVQIGCDGLDVSIRLTIVPSIDNVDITSIPLSPDNVVSSSSSSRAPAEGVSIRLTIVPSIDNVDTTSIPLSPDNVVSSSSSSRAPVSRNVARWGRGPWSCNNNTSNPTSIDSF